MLLNILEKAALQKARSDELNGYLAHYHAPSCLRAPEGKTTSYSSLSTQHLAQSLAFSWCSIDVHD